MTHPRLTLRTALLASATGAMLMVASAAAAQDSAPRPATARPTPAPAPGASDRGLFDDGRVEQKPGEEAK